MKRQVPVQLPCRGSAAALRGHRGSDENRTGTEPVTWAGSHLDGASQQRQQVPADRQQDQQAVKVQAGGWSSGPGQGVLRRHNGLLVPTRLNIGGTVEAASCRGSEPSLSETSEPFLLKEEET